MLTLKYENHMWRLVVHETDHIHAEVETEYLRELVPILEHYQHLQLMKDSTECHSQISDIKNSHANYTPAVPGLAGWIES